MSRSSYPVEHLDINGMAALGILPVLNEIPTLIELSLRGTGRYPLDRQKLVTFIVDRLPQLQRITCDISIADDLIAVLERKTNLARQHLHTSTSIQSIFIDCTMMEERRASSTRRSMSMFQARGMNIILLGC